MSGRIITWLWSSARLDVSFSLFELILLVSVTCSLHFHIRENKEANAQNSCDKAAAQRRGKERQDGRLAGEERKSFFLLRGRQRQNSRECSCCRVSVRCVNEQPYVNTLHKVTICQMCCFRLYTVISLMLSKGFKLHNRVLIAFISHVICPCYIGIL